MSGPRPREGMAEQVAAAVAATAAVADRPIAGLRPVEPGTGGRVWLVALEGPAFLCLDESLAPETSLARVRDVAQASLAAEVIEDLVDPGALRGLASPVEALTPWEAELPAALPALRRAAAASVALAGWRDDPARVVASLPALDEAVSLQERAHAAYATFVGVTEALVERQEALDPAFLRALAAVEAAAGEAGLGSSLGGLMGEGMDGLAAAADEMARGHLTPLR